ncbi:MAG: UDP-N-acetylmuramate--L-alanine ligase [Candidatus Nanopelagicales bacterium]|nr:UDP-N-acetylmuramate--L-alanine ligase [Candidatus Nanopelagicales bacterium]MDZ4248516.1 UDP-N-acetylmuramate--L-alanine ligase [Candidatus Nanopelagicales bacterium]MDZ7577892.1 UDP-N-acetylmuramate--L-alanine ligase [Candidatus Nanopelagicales bacterium]
MPTPEPRPGDLGRVHILGIGGSGQSGLARLMLDRGIAVSGSDVRDAARMRSLASEGVKVYVGHDAAHLGSGRESADTVIVTSVIAEDNPELVEARDRGLRILTRAQGLAIMIAGSRIVGISGTHGKTTTTSMITVCLNKCGADPSFAIGSEVHDLGSNAHTGSSDLFIVEADESDGAFMLMDPVAVAVTNVEPDHMNFWGTFDALEAAFDDFVALPAKNDGFSVVWCDEPASRALAARATDKGVNVLTYGESPDADYRVKILGSERAGYKFNVSREGESLGDVTLRVPGRHNALNATAALAICDGLGYDTSVVMRGLSEYAGARRRFEFKGEAGGVRVYDDFAHHPTAVHATLAAAREFVGSGRVIVAFQPLHYYRVAMFGREFGQALGLADELVILEVCGAGEEPIPGASGQSLVAKVPLPAGHVVFEPSWSNAPERLASLVRPGDIIMTVGPEDVALLGPEVLALLRERQEAQPGRDPR